MLCQPDAKTDWLSGLTESLWVNTSDAQVALDAQGQGKQIDAVLWHQGETDWIYQGTADPEATDAERTEPNYYPRKLNQLIANFRSESYVGKGIFICGETIRADVNPHLMALNNDGDIRNPNGVHFSAQALRDIGRRYAEQYLEIDRALGNQVFRDKGPRPIQ